MNNNEPLHSFSLHTEIQSYGSHFAASTISFIHHHYYTEAVGNTEMDKSSYYINTFKIYLQYIEGRLLIVIE